VAADGNPSKHGHGRFKRSACVVFWFRDGRLQCRNYLLPFTVSTSLRTIAMLQVLDRWRTLDEIASLLDSWSPRSVRKTVLQLEKHGLVVEAGSIQARRERALSLWRVWGEEAAFFHFGTKHAHRGARYVDERKLSRSLLRASPQPPSIKRYRGSRRVDLPHNRSPLSSEFPRVLLARRTVRTFRKHGVAIDQLATLLYLTYGITASIRWPGLGRVPVKTSPSAGARQPLEVYVFARNVRGLAPGVYHYRSDSHQLETIRRGCTSAQLAAYCAGQDWVGQCAALCVMTAVLPRLMWRYRSARAYRVLLLEAGHFCQTFCLTSTWLGLAPFSTAALIDEDIERDLHLDGARESVVYAAGVGA
jgi:SagB-type dehydrogenase family enzyme